MSLNPPEKRRNTSESAAPMAKKLRSDDFMSLMTSESMPDMFIRMRPREVMALSQASVPPLILTRAAHPSAPQ